MANVTVGSLVANNILTITSHPSGSTTFGPLAVPAGFTIFTIMFDLQQVSSLTAVFTGSVEISFDNGTNWTSAGASKLDLSVAGFTAPGGILTRSSTDFFGPGPVRVFGQNFFLRQCDLSTRQIRGTLTCSESLISGVTLAGW